MQKTTKLKTIWKYDERVEILRLMEMLNRIATGFYGSKGFLILPWNKTKDYNTLSAVTIPDLEYKKISRFWHKAKTLDYYHFPVIVNEGFVSELTNLVSSSENFELTRPNTDKLQHQWETIQPKFVSFLSEILPRHIELAPVEIYLSQFGTRCTFKLAKENPAQVRVFLRRDSDLYELLFGILSSLTRINVFETLGGDWEESQLLVDWLLCSSSLGDELKRMGIKHKPSLKQLQNAQNPDLKKESQKFLERLGTEQNSLEFSYNDGGQVHVGNKALKGLSKTERTILQKLIEKQGASITHDEIGNIISKDGNDFSLYAVSKTMERLRTKLEKNNIASTSIQTKRGEGYSLT
jgi:hypothetical protein